MENQTIRLPNMRAGTDLQKVADLAAQLSDIAGCSVLFRFNGLEVHADPGEPGVTVQRRYEAAIRANRIDVIALNAELAQSLKGFTFDGFSDEEVKRRADPGTYDRIKAARAVLDKYDYSEKLPRWRHKRSGGVYEEIGRGRLQILDNVADDRPCVIYRSVDNGSLRARPLGEFEDGRFERMDAT